VDNLLMMDATASAESLTDSRNGNPQSIQVLIRSQEIKVEEDETQEAAKQAAEKTTFWGRVAQMFKDFWAAITGIFH
jgi:putative membrane protein